MNIKDITENIISVYKHNKWVIESNDDNTLLVFSKNNLKIRAEYNPMIHESYVIDRWDLTFYKNNVKTMVPMRANGQECIYLINLSYDRIIRLYPKWNSDE